MKRKLMALLLLTCMLTSCSTKPNTMTTDPLTSTAPAATQETSLAPIQSKETTPVSTDSASDKGRYLSETLNLPEEIRNDSSVNKAFLSDTSVNGDFDFYVCNDDISTDYECRFQWEFVFYRLRWLFCL